MVDWQAFGKQVTELPQIQPTEDEELTYTYEGTRLLKVSPESTMNDMKTFQVREDDLYLISYPKAGTTWMQEIISMVVHEGNEEEVNKTHVFFRFPFLEMSWVSHYSQVDMLPPTHKLIEQMDSPRMIKSHLPGELLPPQIYEKKPKVVYVARNPKDCAVSFYHFHNLDMTLQSYKTWDAFFTEFYDGTVYNGSWFSHNLFWWNKRHEPNVLFMKYEDMKKDLKGAVKQTAKFLGKQLTDDVVARIADHCTFAKMKKNLSANPDTLGFNEDDCKKEEKKKAQPSFMRKGKVGDWKNYFSVAQNDLFDRRFQETMADTGLDFDFN
ncbi:sulfotransferase 1C2-like [Amphiura filiformis]|uniref:sulfotransferase 1C2-like n=1 Tax=Amphiura filiformis TaxID=82378 RepID=UPI003B2246B5